MNGVSLAIWQPKTLIKNVLLSFDGYPENILLSILMYLQIVSTYIYNGYPKSKSFFGLWSHRQTMLWVFLTGATLPDDVIVNFKFQRLGSYWQRLSLSLQIFMDRSCRLTASLQNQEHKILANIFENIFFEAAYHWISIKTLELYANWLKQLLIATPIKRHDEQFVLLKVFCQFVDRKVVGLLPKYFLIAGYTNQVSVYFFSFHKIKMGKQHKFIL